MDNQAINLQLTVAEVNVILRSLGKHPFEEVAMLIKKVKDQGEAQIVPAAPAADVATEQAPAEVAEAPQE